MRSCAFLACLLLTALSFVIDAAEEKPDFSGSWELNTKKSDFKGVPAPKGLRYQIDHKDPTLRVKSSMTMPDGDISVDMEYRTDGKEIANKTPAGEIKTVAKWEGAELFISGQGASLRQDERWSLSPDKRTLTMKVMPENETPITFVLEKRTN